MQERGRLSRKVDVLVTHRIWGFPIFFFVMWLMFYCTFSLGAYPQGWIESGVNLLRDFLQERMSEGALKDLIIGGVVGGVGGVIVFVPNIMILYLFISYMEESGYLARAAFIMDSVMHRIGLHGLSFIPLVMSFGCNVPAIMSTNSIDNRSSRLITIMITPFMSCSARLPVYILLVGTFFPEYPTMVMFALYLLGIALGILTAMVMRRFMFRHENTPCEMELPSYKIPTLKVAMFNMWSMSAQYIKKIGGLILVASLVIWFLSYYPLPDKNKSVVEHYETSYLGHIGKFCEPVFAPMGLDWRANVALLSGIAAKETIVSTIGVLYSEDQQPVTDEQMMPTKESSSLSARIIASGDFDSASAVAFMIFVLLYFPCIATLAAIKAEIGLRWAVASLLYNTSLAWLLAVAAYKIITML